MSALLLHCQPQPRWLEVCNQASPGWARQPGIPTLLAELRLDWHKLSLPDVAAQTTLASIPASDHQATLQESLIGNSVLRSFDLPTSLLLSSQSHLIESQLETTACWYSIVPQTFC